MLRADNLIIFVCCQEICETQASRILGAVQDFNGIALIFYLSCTCISIRIASIGQITYIYIYIYIYILSVMNVTLESV